MCLGKRLISLLAAQGCEPSKYFLSSRGELSGELLLGSLGAAGIQSVAGGGCCHQGLCYGKFSD